MNSKDYRNLQEAYLDVYEQEEALDEVLDTHKSKESYDLYDIILSHLIDEGYADTEQAAEAIMVNMGEKWRETIVETRSII